MDKNHYKNIILSPLFKMGDSILISESALRTMNSREIIEQHDRICLYDGSPLNELEK